METGIFRYAFQTSFPYGSWIEYDVAVELDAQPPTRYTARTEYERWPSLSILAPPAPPLPGRIPHQLRPRWQRAREKI